MVVADELLKKKYRGALFGVAIGDALGAGYEGAAAVPAAALDALRQSPGLMRYTDDTHMTIGLAESLAERKGFDGQHMAATFARRYAEEPWRGYGAGPPQVFRMIEQGAAWDEAATHLFGGSGSFGNGAAMRVAPVALFAYPRLDRVDELARRTATITHSHELGKDGAALQASAVALLLESDGGRLQAERLIDRLAGVARTDTFREKLDAVCDVISGEAQEAVVRTLGNGIAAHESVPTALCAFLMHPDDFADAVLTAISFGGDTDTIAAMTGALSGAYLGEDAIPETWRQHVEGGDALVELADRLFDIAS